MSSLLKIGSKKTKLQDGKIWLHSPEMLSESAVVYAVKFLGVTEVSQAKGTEVIKDAITKVQFANHLKQSEAGKKGSKLKKVDLKISIDAIKVDDAKTKEELYSYPLHHISYCADDKRSKKVFAFIAKDKTSPNHTCYVFECEKMAEDLTLTVGQAFDLAYRKYLEHVGRQKLKEAESEKEDIKQKLSQLEKSHESKSTSPDAAATFVTAAPVQSLPSTQDDIMNLGEMKNVPGIPPPPKQIRQVEELFDPLGEPFPSPNDESTRVPPSSAGLFFDLPTSNGGNANVLPSAIASPFDDPPIALNNVSNPFGEAFDQPQGTMSSNEFGDSFDPLDQVSSPKTNTSFGNNHATSLFGDNHVDGSGFSSGSGFGEPTNNNTQQTVLRPRPTPGGKLASSLPPPPSKQSVKAAKMAAASGVQMSVAPTPSSAPSANHPDTVGFPDLLDVQAPSSPPNPFARPADFDPFADSFDPLNSKSTPATSINNSNQQFQDLTSGFSRGMVLDNNDLFS